MRIESKSGTHLAAPHEPISFRPNFSVADTLSEKSNTASTENSRGFFYKIYDGIAYGWSCVKDFFDGIFKFLDRFFQAAFSSSPRPKLDIYALLKMDFTKYWLVCTRTGQIRVVQKDPTILRWVKSLLYIFSFGLLDVYGHIKIERVVKGIYAHFERDYAISPEAKNLYIELVTNLDETRNDMGKVNSRRLEELKTKISAYDAR